MIERIRIIGSGRVGSAVTARLQERGVAVVDDDPELVLLCVPDSAIAATARSLPSGPWVGHVSGATRLAALDPHERRFSLHPLQTFTQPAGRGPEQLASQLDGAWAAITAESPQALAVARSLAETLGLQPFELADDQRTLYHAGAVFASNYLVTVERAAALLVEAAGVPHEALRPLLQRTVENGFELTGPIARGDWATVQAHRAAIHEAKPELDGVYDALAEATALLA